MQEHLTWVLGKEFATSPATDPQESSRSAQAGDNQKLCFAPISFLKIYSLFIVS